MGNRGSIILGLVVTVILGSGVLILLTHTMRYQKIFRLRKDRLQNNRICRNRLVKEMHRVKVNLQFAPAEILESILKKTEGVKLSCNKGGLKIESFSEGVDINFGDFNYLIVYQKLKVIEPDSRSSVKGGVLLKGIKGRIPVYLLPLLLTDNLPPSKLTLLISMMEKLLGGLGGVNLIKTPYISLIFMVRLNFIEEFCNDW